MRVKVLKEQLVEWKDFNDLRSVSSLWNSDVQTQYYKAMEHLLKAKNAYQEAAARSQSYLDQLVKLNGGMFGEAQVYYDKICSKIYAIHDALEGIDTLAKDIDPFWTMSLRNYNFKKGGEDERP